MNIIKSILLSLILLLFIGCNEKSKPIITVDKNLSTPIKCMALNSLGMDKEFINSINRLYDFNKSCPLKLSISYKKDIVCNSPYNPNIKNVSRFPKSFLKIELREGLKVKYSYYVDLYSNVDDEDIEEGFLNLKNTLLIK